MLKVFIYAVFFATNTGEPTLVKGWYPFPMPSMQACVNAYDRISKQLEYTVSVNKPLESYETGCIKAESTEDAIIRMNKIYNKGPDT
jgi:hypothetical protein